MFKTIIYTLLATSSIAAFNPNQAEAVKLKIEPSVTFRSSRERTYVVPERVPVARVPVRTARVPVRYYPAPAPRREVIYYPEEYVYDDVYYYYYPEYRPTYYNTRTSGTDFGLTFKLK